LLTLLNFLTVQFNNGKNLYVKKDSCLARVIMSQFFLRKENEIYSTFKG